QTRNIPNRRVNSRWKRRVSSQWQSTVERGLSLIKEADIAAGWVMIGDYRSQGIVVEADRDAALEAYQNAADKGDVYALVRLAEASRDGGLMDRDPERSIGLFQRAIDAGHVSARRILGESHLRGRFGARSSPDEGLALLRQAQSLGDQSAPVTLANLYLYGTGVPKDVTRALELLAEAASNGNSNAAKTLISFYRDGRGRDVPKNLSKANAALSSSEAAFSPLDLMREKLLLSVASARSPDRISAVLDEIRAAPPVIASPIIASLRHVNANAYVYFLQQELRDLGIYDGPINGLLTRQTIRAVGTLCSTSKTPGQCSYGPLHSRSANAVLKLLDGI
ncbi:tetratricopeptide repeat protein, partial [Pseudorhizobium flavum]|uniref:tetratricopeptide repeat protein n=1 Tax=Pseudorhizobium flavum TaxID=1335061 RepID=UPI00249059CB